MYIFILILSSIIILICIILLFCAQRKMNKLIQEHIQEQLELIEKHYDSYIDFCNMMNDSSIDFCNMMSTLNELQREQIIKLREELEKLDTQEEKNNGTGSIRNDRDQRSDRRD